MYVEHVILLVVFHISNTDTVKTIYFAYFNIL
jgi:uncharacterized integral membrane protein